MVKEGRDSVESNEKGILTEEPIMGLVRNLVLGKFSRIYNDDLS